MRWGHGRHGEHDEAVSVLQGGDPHRRAALQALPRRHRARLGSAICRKKAVPHGTRLTDTAATALVAEDAAELVTLKN
jgi:hypothetical protein